MRSLYTTKYDEDCDIDTTYMGRTNMKRQDDLKAEHKVPITQDCYVGMEHCWTELTAEFCWLQEQVSPLCPQDFP